MAKRTRTDVVSEQQALAQRRFYTVVVGLVLIVIFMVASVVLCVITPWPASQNAKKTNALFAVKTVTLQGNTRYSDEAVIGISGIQAGQSIFSLKAREVEQTLLNAFPYYDAVQVQTLHMDEVRITVSETSVIGAIYADNAWMLVGENGKTLERREITSDTPRRLLYIRGANAPEGGVKLGGPAMDEYCLGIVKTLLAAMDRYQLTNVTELDLTNKTDLRLCWNGQITVRLGNSSNLEHEIGVVASTIPAILRDRGVHATGMLNVSSYSNDALENQAIFTPSSLLPPAEKPPRRPAPGETIPTEPVQPPVDSGDTDSSWSDSGDDTDDWEDGSWDDGTGDSDDSDWSDSGDAADGWEDTGWEEDTGDWNDSEPADDTGFDDTAEGE